MLSSQMSFTHRSLTLRAALRRFQSTTTTASTSTSTAPSNAFTKTKFQSLLTSNSRLHDLFHSPQPHHSIVEETQISDAINASSTLPIILRSKEAVFHEISKQSPDASGLKFKQWIGYAKSIIKFYRVGVQNTWRSYKEMKVIKAKYQVDDLQGANLIQRRVRGATDLVTQLQNYLSLKEIENNALVANLKPPVDSVINITRREFNIVKRTEPDYWKLPIFSLILLIFGEMTPFIVYTFPHLTPRTCISAGVLQSMNAKNNAKFNEKKIDVNDVYKLSRDELVLANKIHFLIPNFFTFFPSSYYQRRLANHFAYLQVDDYYLLKADPETEIPGLWNLTKSELIRANLDRNLIDLSKLQVDQVKADELKARLLLYLGLKKHTLSYEDLEKIRGITWEEAHDLMKLRHEVVKGEINL